MTRILIAGLLLTLSSVTASAQPAYNPITPTVPPPILPATPPAAQPGMAPPPPLIGQNSRSDQGAANPRILLGQPSTETSNDRAIRCTHQGAALGVPAGAMGQYLGECVNSR
jgi:hypothetical protein